MTNTIPNVPRDDLDLIRAALEGFKPCIARDDALRTVRALLSAPSPAGVDGLDGISERIAKVWIGHAHIDDLITIGKEIDAIVTGHLQALEVGSVSGLAACPFCGGVADPRGWAGSDGAHGPACDDCGATAPDAETWNRRHGAKGVKS